MRNAKILFLMRSMGYNNRLLYWDPLLRFFFSAFPKTKIWTSETQSKVSEVNLVVEKRINYKKLSIGKVCIKLPPFDLLSNIRKESPDLVVISEFGVISLLAVAAKFFFRDFKLLLLVESDPTVLKHIGIFRDNFFHRLYRRIIISAADSVVTNSEKGRSYLVHVLRVSEKKIKVKCYLTSAIDQKPKLKTPRLGSRFFLLYVGRLDPLKGIDNVLKAMDLLPKNLLERVLFRIVGDGPDKERLTKLVRDMNLQASVEFCGLQPYEKLSDFYRSSDVFVLPTLGDYRALVGFEALSAGLPVITSVFDGAGPEVVREGVNGFVVDPRDHLSLANKILYLLQNKEMLVSFSEQSLLRSELYSFGRTADNLIEVCKSLLKPLLR